MFTYRFPCDNKEELIRQINEKMSYDRPNETGRNAYPLYAGGFHFTHNGEVIKGFYTTNGRSYRGAPSFRSRFNARFIEENGLTVLKVQFYPQILVFLSVVAVMVLSLIFLDNYLLPVLAFILLCAFGRLYFKATKEAVAGFKRMTMNNEGE